MCSSSLPQRKTLFKIPLYLFAATRRWEVRLVTDIMSSDSVAFRKSFMLQTATAHPVHLDGNSLSTATSFYVKNSQENTTEARDSSGNEECGGVFFCTQEMWIGWPFLLSLGLPLQCKSALTSAAGLLECVLPRERARATQ